MGDEGRLPKRQPAFFLSNFEQSFLCFRVLNAFEVIQN
jgi:hypothetical protein